MDTTGAISDSEIMWMVLYAAMVVGLCWWLLSGPGSRRRLG